jgi:hypothetical protein
MPLLRKCRPGGTDNAGISTGAQQQRRQSPALSVASGPHRTDRTVPSGLIRPMLPATSLPAGRPQRFRRMTHRYEELCGYFRMTATRNIRLRARERLDRKFPGMIGVDAPAYVVESGLRMMRWRGGRPAASRVTRVGWYPVPPRGPPWPTCWRGMRGHPLLSLSRFRQLNEVVASLLSRV